MFRQTYAYLTHYDDVCQPTGKPVGFLVQNTPRPSGPYMPPSTPSGPPESFVPPPWQSGPFSSQRPPFSSPPSTGIPFPQSTIPPQPAPSLQGMFQNLASSLGALDIQSLISNAQKWIGMVNQIGSVIKQAAPLLQLIQGLSSGLGASDEVLSDWSDEDEQQKKRKKSKGKKNRAKQQRSVKKNRTNKRAS